MRTPGVFESVDLAPIEQHIQVSFRYRVAFTWQLFRTARQIGEMLAH